MISDASLSPPSPQPTNFDLALCIIILRSQPIALSTLEYVGLLRSLTVTGRRPTCLSTNIEVTQLRYLDGVQKERKLLNIAEGKISELRLNISEVERQRDGLQKRLDDLQKSSTEKHRTEIGKKKKIDCAVAGDKPQTNIKRGLHGIVRMTPKDVEAEVIDVHCFDDLASWSEFAPQLLVPLKLLRQATTPGILAVTIHQICEIMSTMVESLCGNTEWNDRGEGGSMPVAKRRPPTDAYGPTVGRALETALDITATEILLALDKLHKIMISGQGTTTEQDASASACYHFINYLTNILTSLHANSVTILWYHHKRSLQAKAQLAVPQPLPCHPVTSNSKTCSPNQTSTEGHLQPFCAPNPVIDLRKELTRFLTGHIMSLRSDTYHHRELVKGMAFKLMNLLGAYIVAFSPGPSGGKPNDTKRESKRKKGRAKSPKRVAEEFTIPEMYYANELAGEETAWFWLEILDCVLDRYWDNIRSENSQTHETSPEDGMGCRGPQTNVGTQNRTTRGPSERLVDKARMELKEILLEAVLGPNPKIAAGSSSEQMKVTNRDMRLSNLPVIDEIWKMVGWE